MPSYTASTPLLASQALDQGFVVAIPDADGTMRRLPLVIRHENNLYASLSLVMARLTLNAHWVRLDTASNGRQQVATSINLGGKLHIPVSEDGSVLIPYRGPAGSFSIIPATRILNNRLSEPETRQL
ncbi:MAG: CHASE2 domain-containing protein, partial [Thiopseudomonas sp.]